MPLTPCSAFHSLLLGGRLLLRETAIVILEAEDNALASGEAEEDDDYREDYCGYGESARTHKVS